MVDVAGEFCIDRYEANFVDHDQERAVSPFFHPTRARTRSSYDEWRAETATPTSLLGSPSERQPKVPAPPAWQLREVFRPRAKSQAGVHPQGYLNGIVARAACENAGKRLCLEEEWVRACRGELDRAYPYGDTYEAGACNVARDHHPAAILHGNASVGHRDPRLNLVEDSSGPLLRPTGSMPRCSSRWGDDSIYDMVGNLDEWIDDETGVFVGGFYARQTEAGCASRIGAHPLEYYDYSLGVRCCA
jgi:formylglycine-generating enzyme required for sulfatase activity